MHFSCQCFFFRKLYTGHEFCTEWWTDGQGYSYLTPPKIIFVGYKNPSRLFGVAQKKYLYFFIVSIISHKHVNVWFVCTFKFSSLSPERLGNRWVSMMSFHWHLSICNTKWFQTGKVLKLLRSYICWISIDINFR